MKFQSALGALSLALPLGFSCLITAPVAAADAFPSKPIRLIVGYSPGSGADLAARFVASRLQETFKQAVIVDNKPGAGGLIAAQEVARAPADGYTLLLGAMPQMIVAPELTEKPPYDTLRDFEAVTELVSSDMILTTNPDRVPAANLAEFATWARAQNQVFMGTPGMGTVAHLGSLMLADRTKFKPEIVHYKTTGDSIVGMMNGDIQAAFLSLGVAAPLVKAGKLRALVNAGPARSPLLPEAPTFKDAGYAGLEFATWYGLFAPAKTPAAILAKVGEEALKGVGTPDSRAKLEAAGLVVTGTSRAEFTQKIRDEKLRWAKAIKTSKSQARN